MIAVHKSVMGVAGLTDHACRRKAAIKTATNKDGVCCHLTWKGVTCKACLKHKPRKKRAKYDPMAYGNHLAFMRSADVFRGKR